MKRLTLISAGVLAVLGTAGHASGQHSLPREALLNRGWKVHSLERPKPPVVTPPAPVMPAPPPPGAVVLFDGTDLSAWAAPDGGPAAWRVRDGHMEVAPGAGAIRTRAGFGDVHLHLEWATPDPPQGTGQDRGNSGVIFMGGRYEVQVLDSYRSDTYADGQAAAIYGQFPPRVNASRAPGEWQTYDIFFRRPRFDAAGALLEPARITVVHNGILVQNNEQLLGRTAWLKYLPYEAHPDALPVELQDHGSPVRFRNVWALPLPEHVVPTAAQETRAGAIQLSAAELERFTGVYHRPGAEGPITVTREGDLLLADFYWRRGGLAMLPVSATEFVLRDTDGRVEFQLDTRGRPTGLVFHLGGASMPAHRGR